LTPPSLEAIVEAVVAVIVAVIVAVVVAVVVVVVVVVVSVVMPSSRASSSSTTLPLPLLLAQCVPPNNLQPRSTTSSDTHTPPPPSPSPLTRASPRATPLRPRSRATRRQRQPSADGRRCAPFHCSVSPESPCGGEGDHATRTEKENVEFNNTASQCVRVAYLWRDFARCACARLRAEHHLPHNGSNNNNNDDDDDNDDGSSSSSSSSGSKKSVARETRRGGHASGTAISGGTCGTR
jgi:uncharacterized membrane protein YgcG